MAGTPREYHIQILGRTLEHLGAQMYKRRDAAIAELIANSWDAGAKEVHITVPEGNYDAKGATISVRDNGRGMDPEQVETDYLIVGRNTRKDGNDEVEGRLITGRKGIGKLAGFGIASKMTLLTWRDNSSVELTLDINELKTEDGKSERKPIMGVVGAHPEGIEDPTGTMVTLSDLKQVTAIDVEQLHQSLARRFSRAVRGEMAIFINEQPLQEAQLEFVERFPASGVETVKLDDGKEIQYWYGITEKVIKPAMMQGFSIMVREKIGQLPPFYFGVENTASHQVGTKYFSGEIFANVLDSGSDDGTDKVSTDRQEISWDDPETIALNTWGQKTVRSILNRIYERKAEEVERWVLEEDPALKQRISALDQSSMESLKKVLHSLGQSGLETKEDTLQVADGLVRAYEFQQFFDLTNEIEAIANVDPMQLKALLQQISNWRVLESRAMLELIKGRLTISDTLHDFIANDTPETASVKTPENMHDLIARMPWLLNPDWELFNEEKTVSKQLEEWNAKELAGELSEEEARMRYDFIAYVGEEELLIIEIKRSGHAVEFEEMQRLDTYMENLSRAWTTKKVKGVLISSGKFNVSEDRLAAYRERDDYELLDWGQIYQRNRKHYGHYRAVLEGNVNGDGFEKKVKEVQQHKAIAEAGTVKRTKKERKDGLGPQ